jgi:hypothetical protein
MATCAIAKARAEAAAAKVAFPNGSARSDYNKTQLNKAKIAREGDPLPEEEVTGNGTRKEAEQRGEMGTQ